jgi:hypothetical protein
MTRHGTIRDTTWATLGGFPSRCEPDKERIDEARGEYGNMS